jgi:ATP-dependent DNA ligase
MSFRPELAQGLLDNLRTRKLTGRAAEKEVHDVMKAFERDGRDLLYRILSKDLKCGIGTTTIGNVAPELLPSFAVMRAQPYEERHVKRWPVKVEYKLDGQRNTFLCRNGEGSFFTRSGKPVPALDFFVPTLIDLAKRAPGLDPDLAHVLWNDENEPDFMLDGEAMMGLFAETGALRRKNASAENAELHLYDIMPFEDFDAPKIKTPLHLRRAALERFVRIAKKLLHDTDRSEMIQIVPQYFANSHEEIDRLFRRSQVKTLASYLARGDAARERDLLKTTLDKVTGKPKVLEGVMIKDPDAPYEKKKSRAWMKLKAEETEDLEIVDAEPGAVGTKYEDCLGALVVDRAGVRVKVGGGFSDEERVQLWKDYQHDTAKSAAIEPLLLGRLVEVEFHEVTPDGSLRHPRFVRFRDDKQGEIESKEDAA